MRPLCVLLWKHFVVRKRKLCGTIMEFFFSVALILILYWIRNSSGKAFGSISLSDKGDAPALRRIAYAPNTDLTYLIMDEVGAKLNIPRLNELTERGEAGFFAFSSLPDLRSVDAIVIFLVNLKISWPERLNYTIHMGNDFYPSPPFSPLGPDSIFVPLFSNPYVLRLATLTSPGTSYQYEPLLRLQWAIDTAYLHLLTGADINQTLALEEYPLAAPPKIPKKLQLANNTYMVCEMALLLIFTFLMSNLLIDKNSGIQELIKMEGVSIKTISLAQFLSALPGGLVYAMSYPIVLKLSDTAIFPKTSSMIILLALILHFVSIMSCAFIAAYLVDTNILITTTCFFSYVIPTLFFDYIAAEFQSIFKRKTLVILTALFPHRPLNWILTEIGVREAYEVGVTFGNMGTVAGEQSGSVFAGLVLMVVQTVLFTLVAWYLTQVRPGPYGQAEPCTFLCKKSYWSKTPEVNTVTVEERTDEVDRKYFEEPPEGLPTGIQIINVTKKFPRHVAVSNMSLNVYKDEITVLLGHNGAGKSTIMNIITGLTGATSGKVLVNGMDTSVMRSEVRSQMGLCPQHNLFFPDLTIMEHTRFFGMLKGGKYSEVKKDSIKLLTMLNVLDKANNMAHQLSGGMKRRLQLACALVGGASVLILDEPTSGLDVETRRELWDLLLQLRGSRTVLLTTHFMEEADALGDRIAAMYAGTLRCHATPMFLKRAYGTGYRLALTTAGPPREAAITAAIRGSIPEATVRDHSLKAISYNLPAKDSSQFPALFSNLEAKRSELGIYTIGVGKSTLEDVFLALCSDCTSEFETDQTVTSVPVPSLPKLTGPLLYLCQFAYLLRRQFYYITSKFVAFLFYQAIMPIVIIFLLAKFTNNELFFAMTTKSSLDAEDVAPERRVLYDIDAEDALLALRMASEDVQFQMESVSVALHSGSLDVSYLNKLLVGFELNDTNAKALYSSAVRLAAPAAVNLLSNALAARHNASAGARTITTRVQPLDSIIIYPKHQIVCGIWYILFAIVYTNVLAGYTQLPSTERATGTRHIHLMSGCPLLVYWAATLFAHMVLGIVFLILPNAIVLYFFDVDKTFNAGRFLFAVSVILLLGLMAVCSLMYLVSVLSPARVTYAVLVVMNVTFCIVTPMIYLIMELLELPGGIFYGLSLVISFVVPHHTLTIALFEATVVAILNAWCDIVKENCPALTFFFIPEYNEVCCKSTFDYSSFKQFHPGRKTMALVFQFVFYFILLLLADHGLFEVLCDRYQNYKLKLPKRRFKDPVITAEKNYVAQTIIKPKNQITDAILCYRIHKKFNTFCGPLGFGRSHYAVKGVSFSVKKGECFGMLGVNGAGKSTIFKMLSSELCTSRGNIFSNGFFINLRSKTKYMRTFSYCPQFFGLDDFLTGRQNLELVLTLRGLSIGDARHEAASWIEEVGLTRYADKRVSTYSGGCARRLAAAGALCQHSDTALLDEPTAGVDLAARRRLQTAMLRAKHSKSVILASHSMDEMEALCDRIIIISAGEICAFGSAAELRAQYAAGYAVTFKLFQEFSSYAAMVEDETNEPEKIEPEKKEHEEKPENKEPQKKEHEKKESQKKEPAKKKPQKREPEKTEPENKEYKKKKREKKKSTAYVDPAKLAIKKQFMKEMHSKFSKCELKDDHRTMMRYHIHNVMPYSELFAHIEALKSQFPQLIEDYTLTETTLEEVFLFFAKQSHKAKEQKATQVA